MSNRPIAAGKSSIDLVDIKKVFQELPLREGMALLDIACGNGAYSIALSKHIGQSGEIHAVDLWKEGIEYLQQQIISLNIKTIKTHIADISNGLPVEDYSIDLCLMATVLHDLIVDKTDDGALKEVVRVLKPKGILAVIEFKKIEGPPGPPLAIRISPDQVAKQLSSYSFQMIKTEDIGHYNYLSVFTKR